MPKLTIKISSDQNRINKVTTETVGAQGESCLLTTGAIARLNPDAEQTMTGEFYQEMVEEPPQRLRVDEQTS
jgi:hypothetical protein